VRPNGNTPHGPAIRGVYSFGDDETLLGDYAWYSGNGDYAWYSENLERWTRTVRTRKPNTFGLYDMHGNVWQWVEDAYHKSYQYAPSDGIAWTEWTWRDRTRVIRGGSWYDDPDHLRSASRREDAYPLISAADAAGGGSTHRLAALCTICITVFFDKPMLRPIRR
jgi:formylglycine-generating enzyme required for sulfatase activity